MKNEDFTTTVVVDATPQRVFEAVNNVRGWWSENIDGKTDHVNSEFLYHYQDVHRSHMKITEYIPDKKIVWHVLDNYFKFNKDKSEWKDTRVVFEISQQDGKTELKFTHQGLVPQCECFDICRDAWIHYLHGSLKDLITTGKGKPTPMDIEPINVETQPQEKILCANDTSMKSICHRLLIKAPVEKVYESLSIQEGLSAWWTPDTKAKPVAGSVSRFAFGDYFKEMKIEELQPYSKVKWLCLKGYEEWIGTTITFELEPHQKGATLFFHHDGWAAYSNGFASCSYDWALFLRSLKFLCETGKGIPYPDFNK